MREIKFRAWDKEKREMVFDAIELDLRLLSLPYIETKKYEIGFSPESEGRRFEIMQFTGLKDKDGKEIYEGDLLTSNVVYLEFDSDIKKDPCQVVWVEDLAGFSLRKAKYGELLSPRLTAWKSSIFKVVGNIYENPEIKISGSE